MGSTSTIGMDCIKGQGAQASFVRPLERGCQVKRRPGAWSRFFYRGVNIGLN